MAASSSRCNSLADVLTSWGLGQLASVFEDAEIDLEAFRLLDEDTARAVLTPGSFLKFWSVFKERKEELALGTPPSPKRRRIISDEVSDDDNDSDYDSDADGDIDKVTEELKSLFTSSFIGETLLTTTYEDRDDSERNRIAEIVVTEELRKTKPVGHISKGRLIGLSKAITQLFIGEEKNTFYIPYKKINNAVFTAKGKLTNQYYYWRQKGVKAQILNPLQSCNSVSSKTVDIPENVDQSVKWLSVNLGPEQVVLDHWRTTYGYRMSLLDVNRKDKITVSQYFSKFPVLRQQMAVKLFLQDYETLYKGTENNLSLNFTSFAQKLVEKYKKQKDLDLEELQQFLDLNHGVSVCHHFLQKLSLLFPAQVVVRGRKPNNWTATKAEMQKGFLLHVATEAELEAEIQKRVHLLTKFKKPLPFTPFPVIVGANLKSIEKSFVVVQPKERYLCSTPAEAIDCAFKIVHSLCLEYPPEAKSMWMLVQQSVYKLNTTWDSVPPSLIPLFKFFK